MPFLPHTESDVQAMLKAIGVDSIEQLFDEIPPQLIVKRLEHVPETANEMEVARLMKMRAARDTVELCFAGALPVSGETPPYVVTPRSRDVIRAPPGDPTPDIADDRCAAARGCGRP